MAPASSATPAASSSGPEIASSVTEFTPLRVGSEVLVRTPGPLHRTSVTADQDLGPAGRRSCPQLAANVDSPGAELAVGGVCRPSPIDWTRARPPGTGGALRSPVDQNCTSTHGRPRRAW